MESHSFPFGERVYYFGSSASECVDREADGAFCAVEVVIYSSAGEYEQWCCDPPEVERTREFFLETVFDFLNRHFGGLGKQFPVYFFGMISDMCILTFIVVVMIV